MRKRTKEEVALVVVHGMGRQLKSETLLEWAEPLVQRIDWIARGFLQEESRTSLESTVPPAEDAMLAREIVFDSVDLTGDVPHVTMSVSYPYQKSWHTLRLSITEAHWAESFVPLSRKEVFKWGNRFLGKSVGRVGDYLTLSVWLMVRWAAVWSPLGKLSLGLWINPLLRAIVVFVAALVAGAGIGLIWTALGLLWIVGQVFLVLAGPLLIFPLFKSFLDNIVALLVDFIGDVPIWTSKPVRAAALRERIRSVINRASEPPSALSRKPRVVVVAHSEGAAITAETLFSSNNAEQNPSVAVFISVGAGITLLGPSGSGRSNEDTVPGSRPLVNLVDEWATASRRTRWYNFWGMWDPVPSGPISIDSAARMRRWEESQVLGAAPTDRSLRSKGTDFGPEEHPVHNTGLALTDHQTYARNIAQVVDPIARLVMGLPLPVPAEEPETDKEEEFALRSRLHARSVEELGANRVSILLLAGWLAFAPGFTAGIVTSVGDGVAALLYRLLEIPENTGWLAWAAEQWWFAPIVAVAIAGLPLLLWNEKSWKSYAEWVAWRKPPELRDKAWRVGSLLRGFTLAILVTIAGFTLVPFAGWWSLVVAIVAAVSLFFSPGIGPLPRVVASGWSSETRSGALR
jgi:hypothetical protein